MERHINSNNMLCKHRRFAKYEGKSTKQLRSRNYTRKTAKL
jgi:hypothetical protein